MCKWKSGIVTRSGEIYTHWNTDSHEELITYFNLNDKGLDYLVRVEYSPEDIKDIADVSKYILKVDEGFIPAWFEEKREHVESEMKQIVERSIKTSGEIELILDGVYILGGESKVNKIKGGRILSICGSASVEYIYDSASVENICGSASVKNIYDSASVEYIYGSASVKNICDSASVENICGSASVENICGSARIINDKRIKETL
jgi:hypothetical protein